MIDTSRAPAKSTETILIVEDEVLTRMDVADYLRECGYHVVEAGNASEAIEILRSGRHIDLVFSDVQLPGSMDGFALARWVRAHQEIKVILTSGVAQSTEIAAELCHEGPLEPKPYDPQHLLQRIRATLARVRKDDKPDDPERLRSVR